MTADVTFLMTDVEGSTLLWEREPARMAAAMARHDALVDECAAATGGRRVKARGEGDSSFLVFPDVPAAAACAETLQTRLGEDELAGALGLRVRMAIHVGATEQRDEDFYGPVVNRCARLRELAHGGQVLLSAAARDALPADRTLDLGLHRLRHLSHPERVGQLGDRHFPPLRSLGARPQNLPARVTSLVGRLRDISAVSDLLAVNRIVTIVGPGGVGKTRLSLEVADRMGEAEAVWFVDLSSVTDPALVTTAVAAALGLQETPGRALLEGVVADLGASRVLVVLDNCEHVIDEAASVADAIVRGTGSSRVLATSRERLGLAGEQVWPLAPLAEDDAVDLFVARAASSRPGFALDGRDHPAVSELCRALDGVPLAIELAAGRMGVMGLHDLVARSADALGLAAGSRRRGPRQQTLRDTIAWSYALLDERERRVFRQLSVFAGPFDLVAVEAILGAPAVAAVLDLVERSLVSTDESGNRIAYRLLQTIRAFAAERLEQSGEDDATRARHLEALIARPDLSDVLGEVNAALEWATRTGRARDGARLALHAAPAWRMGGRWTEARRWLDAIDGSLTGRDDHEDVGVADRALLAATVAEFAQRQGDVARTDAASRRVLGLVDAGEARARACVTLGLLAAERGQRDEAAKWYEEALAIARDEPDPSAPAAALNNLGNLAVDAGDPDLAARYYGDALEAARAGSYLPGELLTINNLAVLAQSRGDSGEARRLLAEAASRARAANLQRPLASILLSLGSVTEEAGDYEAALALYRESLPVHAALDNQQGEANAHYCIGHVLLLLADTAGAREHLEAALALARASAWWKGEAAVRTVIAWLLLDAGDPERALLEARAALTRLSSLGDRSATAIALLAFADAAAAAGRADADSLRATAIITLASVGTKPPVLHERRHGPAVDPASGLDFDEAVRRALGQGK